MNTCTNLLRPVQSQPVSKDVYKIHLSSADAAFGTPANCTFNVNLAQQPLAGKVKVVVESFVVNNRSSGALNSMFYRVNLLELLNRRSYSSSSGGMSTLLLTNVGYNWTPREQGGTILPAADFFNFKNLTVTITSPAFAVWGYTWNANDTWDLVLNVLPVD